MLVLSRKRGEAIVVPQCALSVTVVAVQGNAVRLGISAPSEVAVHREELWREIAADDCAVSKNAEPQAAVSQHSLDAFAAELSDAARRIAERHGLADRCGDSNQGLSQALATTIQNWGRRFAQSVLNSDYPTHASQAAQLPR